MNPDAATTIITDHPVFFDADGPELLGLFTTPPVEPNGTVVIQMWGAGAHPSCGRNRFRSQISQRLAASGFHVFRFDHEGIGESPGEAMEPHFDDPYLNEARGAIEWLRSQEGLSGTIFLANCLGTRAALAVASEVPDLRGVVLMRPPVLDLNHLTSAVRSRSVTSYARSAARPSTLRRLMASPGKRRFMVRLVKAKVRDLTRRRRDEGSEQAGGDALVSPRFAKPLAQLLGRGIPVLIVYPCRESFYNLFMTAREGRLGRVLDEHADIVTIETIDGADLYATVENQEQLAGIVDAWINGLAARA